MNKSLRLTALVGFLALMTAPFTNCANYTPPSMDESSSLADLVCDKPGCVTPTKENLAIKVGMAGRSDINITEDIAEFNLGGTCNEGGYPYNIIKWELINSRSGAVVRNSDMLGMITASPSSNANSACANGRFSIYVGLRSISGDPTNRTGLPTDPYYLTVEIIGTYSATATVGDRYAATGKVSVPLK